MTRFHDPTAEDCWFLVSTNRDLEAITIEEIETLGGTDTAVHHPGMVQFRAPESIVPRFHARGRSIHRLMLEVARGNCTQLDGIYDVVRELDITRYLGPAQSFAVRAQRRGDHPFGSPDVESTVGQAIIDEYRSCERTRPPVDLDEPDLIFRVFVRGDTVTVTIDTTGQYSLHRRKYRVNEHEAPIRPTMAYAMFELADCRPDDRLLDPMCGCGTIPIEAARADRPPVTGHEPAFERFRFLDSDPDEPVTFGRGVDKLSLDIVGADIDEAAVAGARENATAAGLTEELSFEVADARTTSIDTDVVITDMPFGIRTDGDIRPLYTDFSDRLLDGNWRRLVVHTAREELLELEPTNRIDMRRGRLETSILVFD